MAVMFYLGVDNYFIDTQDIKERKNGHLFNSNDAFIFFANFDFKKKNVSFLIVNLRINKY